MNYFLAVILPPVAVFQATLGRSRALHVLISAVLFAGALVSLWAADTGLFMSGYASGPVLYVLSLIHAFVNLHRHFQSQSGQIHPHRGSATQSKPTEPPKKSNN